MEARAAPAHPGWIMDGFTYNDDWLVVVAVHVVAGEGVNRTSRRVSILKAFSTGFSIGRFASSFPSPDHHSPSCPSSTVYSCPSCSLLRNSWSRRRSACSPVSVSKTLILVSQTFIPTTGVTSFTALMNSSSNNNNRFLAMISWYVSFLVFPMKTHRWRCYCYWSLQMLKHWQIYPFLCQKTPSRALQGHVGGSSLHFVASSARHSTQM